MPRMAFLLLAMIFSASAQGETLWKGTSAKSVVDGAGDVLDTEGATIQMFQRRLRKFCWRNVRS